ncbi:hypothetical protein B0T25DRAFT_537440 [Lasiosphaeria hispida]|uniref:BHLH domain-containing protein n=1 Tax=Lasiosphaeria hispida TaxID=260671 RepID=A0AAJ0HKY6_9PEZI|nr:hypothetical protein B0T25DRAFT_537440 [Lasiosphaeria hispida]
MSDLLLPASAAMAGQYPGMLNTHEPASDHEASEGKVPVPPSNKPAPSHPQGTHELSLGKDPDLPPEPHVVRYDSWSIMRRAFSQPERTNTNTSIGTTISLFSPSERTGTFASTATNNTDYESASLSDDPEDQDASASRRNASAGSTPTPTSIAIKNADPPSIQGASSPSASPRKHSSRRTGKMSSPSSRQNSFGPRRHAIPGPIHPGAIPIHQRGLNIPASSPLQSIVDDATDHSSHSDSCQNSDAGSNASGPSAHQCDRTEQPHQGEQSEELRVRAGHNLLEEQYRKRLHEKFEQLLNDLPGMGIDDSGKTSTAQQGRLSRAEILTWAGQCIRRLQDDAADREVEQAVLPTQGPLGSVDQLVTEDMTIKSEAADHGSCGDMESAGQDFETAFNGEDEMIDEPYTSEPSDISDFTYDYGASSSPNSDEKLVQDVCEKLLKNVFGVDIYDLATTGIFEEVYNSIRQCLEEISCLIPANHLTAFCPSVNELGRDSTGSNHIPIRPAADGSGQEGKNSGGGGGDKGIRRKRPSNDGDDFGDDGDDGDDDPGDDGPSGNKRPRTDKPGLSCPFRKRNPTRFNVRDHQSCAVQSFPDMSLLKRHIKLFHQQSRPIGAYTCQRCKRTYESQTALDSHVNVSSDRVCTFHEVPSSQDPEDGIDSKTEEALNGRRANAKINEWDLLWKTLFGDPLNIPGPEFVPPVELDEVKAHICAKGFLEDLHEKFKAEGLKFLKSGPAVNVDQHATNMLQICIGQFVQGVDNCRRERTITTNQSQQRKAPRRTKTKVAQKPANLAQESTGLSHLSLPQAPHTHNGVYVGESNGNSPSSSGGASSVESWAHVGSDSTIRPPNLDFGVPNLGMHPQPSGYPEQPNANPLLDQVAMNGNGNPSDSTQTLAYLNGWNHQRGPSTDSAVAGLTGMDLQPNNILVNNIPQTQMRFRGTQGLFQPPHTNLYQPHHQHQNQRPQQVGGYMGAMGPPQGRARYPAQAVGQQPIDPNMAAIAIDQSLNQNLFPYSSPMGDGGLGFPPAQG